MSDRIWLLRLTFAPDGTPCREWEQVEEAPELLPPFTVELREFAVPGSERMQAVACTDGVYAKTIARLLESRGMVAGGGRMLPDEALQTEQETLRFRLNLAEPLPEKTLAAVRKKIEKLAVNYTYMIECADGTLYTGWTNDLQKRMAAHAAGTGCRYTKAHGFGRIAYYECHVTKRRAMQREWEIKQFSRENKQNLIKQWTNGEK